MSEQSTIKSIMLEFTRRGDRIFRQNVGRGWTGKIHRINSTDILIKHARPLIAGLAVGSSDLIGWTRVVVTKDMVGETIAVFTANEVKTKRVKVTEQQQAFIDTVNKAGGIGKIIYEQ